MLLPKIQKKDTGSRNVITFSRDRDSKSGVYDKTSGDVHQNPGIFVQRQGEHAQHTNDTFGRKESENPRTGTAIGESMRTKKPVKVRKKPKPKGNGFPRL